MQRIIYVLGVAILAVALYAANPPQITADSTEQPQPQVVAAAEVHSQVARLAEASMAMRQKSITVAGHFPEPRPEVLFDKK